MIERLASRSISWRRLPRVCARYLSSLQGRLARTATSSHALDGILTGMLFLGGSPRLRNSHTLRVAISFIHARFKADAASSYM